MTTILSDTRLADARRRYAETLCASLPDADPRLRAAFGAVPREAFLGAPPWTVLGAGSGRLRISDPAELYADVLVALDAGKGINNGSPSLHAIMLHRLEVRPGERVLHVGCGTGYYSALLAELTGPDGRVTAVEYDAWLARAARSNLLPWPWVDVRTGDGAEYPTETTDRIYVNCAVAQPAEHWLDRLAPGGRLLLPLGVADPHASGADRTRSGRAALLTVTRAPDGYAATLDIPVAFICAEGVAAGDAPTRAALWEALGRDRFQEVRSLRRGPASPDIAWYSSARFSLCRTPA